MNDFCSSCIFYLTHSLSLPICLSSTTLIKLNRRSKNNNCLGLWILALERKTKLIIKSFEKKKQKMKTDTNNIILISNDLEETIASGIVEPRVIVWTSNACLQIDRFAGHIFWCELACMRHPAGLRSFDRTLFSPWLEVLDFGNGAWILDPLNDLCHCHKVNVVVVR